MNPSFLVVFNICEIQKSGVDRYLSYIDSIVNQNYDNFKVIVSGCKVSKETKNALREKFGNKISYYYTDHYVTVNVTFNRAVQRAVREFGEFDGYIYLDSGINLIGDNVLTEIKERFITGKYTMISLNVNHDSGNDWWFSDLPPQEHQIIPVVREKDFVIPLGKSHNLHAQLFHNDIYKAFNNKLIPDIFMGHCTESTFSFLNAALGKDWVIVKDIIMHHQGGGDGGSSCYGSEGPRRRTWDNFYGGLHVDEIFGTPEAKDAGLGYEEIKHIPNNPYVHTMTNYNEDGKCKDKEKLKNYIKEKLFLSNKHLDYELFVEEFIPQSSSSKPVLIIGDSCLDVFKYCKCDRLCPEAPVPVLDIIDIKENGGMAMNVFNNYLKLSSEVEIITNKDWKKHTKTRFMDIKTNHMFIRIDHEENEKSSFKDFKNNIDFKKYSAIVISDYNKGFLDEEDIVYISDNHELTFLDTKKIIGEWAKNITFIKINRKEYDESFNSIKDNLLLLNKIIKTIGKDGADFNGKKYPVNEVEIKDLSGAGDTFLASLVYGYLQNKDIHTSIELANTHATIVVQKRGVATI